MNKKPKTLEPYKEVSIDPVVLLFGIIVFALVFGLLGLLFRHYVPLGC